jgi:dTDP-4-dehydrorhamnose 3,5-epimerase
MNLVPTKLAGLFVIEPRVFADARGFFMETFHEQRFDEQGLPCRFVQDNHSRSSRGTLRGLHYQVKHPQGKLIQVIRGEIFDVAVDLRRESPTFGQWFGVHLSDANHRQLLVPPQFAHGFCVVSEMADIVYKCTDFYSPAHERTILWSDPQLAIDWPITNPLLSEKDQRGQPFAEAAAF